MREVKVQVVREQLGLTQRQFGELLNAHPITVSRWERGRGNPSLQNTEFLGLLNRFGKSKEMVVQIKEILAAQGGAAAKAYVYSHAFGLGKASRKTT